MLWLGDTKGPYGNLTYQKGHGWGSDKYDYTPLASFGVLGEFTFSWFLGGSGYVRHYPASCKNLWTYSSVKSNY